MLSIARRPPRSAARPNMTPQKSRRWCRAALLAGAVASLLALASAGWALTEYSQDAVKAAFLLRFAEYVEWPPEALATRKFTIAVLGADGVVKNLRRLQPGYPIKNLPVQIRRIRSIQELGDAQLLYLGPGRGNALRAAVAKVAARPVLLVTDMERNLDAGGTVNFVLVDRRVRFEVSLPAAARSGLQISSNLLSVAVRVQTAYRSSTPACESQGTSEAAASGCEQRDIVRDSAGPAPVSIP
jgi:hypothetical protein